MKTLYTLSIPILLVSCSLFAEPFSHKTAQINYRADNWSVNVEKPINDDFYVAGFAHYTGRIENKTGDGATAKIIGGSFRFQMMIDDLTQFYSGLDLVQSNIEVSPNSLYMDDNYFYPGVVAGLQISMDESFMWDVSISQYFSDNSVEYNYLDSMSGTVEGRYFIDQSMSVGMSYRYSKDQSSSIKDNIGVSFSLYFE